MATGSVSVSGYNAAVEDLRDSEYPMLKQTTYLDHAGTTLYPKSLIERFSADMMSNLYGNPHSASDSSQRSMRRIEDARSELLSLFNADPGDFDIVFVANATAGIKLVTEAFRGCPLGFRYIYHRDCHTSLVGVRECAIESRCLESDTETESWLVQQQELSSLPCRNTLFAYPGQSNMNGRRLPLRWSEEARYRSEPGQPRTYSLLDAAALVSTSPLDLGSAKSAPDFTIISLCKIFGFPDLGAIVVRKDAANIFDNRQYFGGGTVDLVVCSRDEWHSRKSETLHDRLEDGTLPIHSIIALKFALQMHKELFGSLEMVSKHTLALAKQLYHNLSSLRHGTGQPVCEIYKDPSSSYDDKISQGPVVSFNIRNAQGAWISNHEFEKLAAIKKIDVRTGGLCNPGGISSSLGLASWELKQNFSAGQRCGNENDIMLGKPTGMIRLSLGAMSSMEDVSRFTRFMHEFFVEPSPTTLTKKQHILARPAHGNYFVESIMVYPIKSCAGWSVTGTSWPVRAEGLAWDREWCLVHSGTATSLSQKKYPKMALLRPEIDLAEGLLRVRYVGSCSELDPREVILPLSADPRYFAKADGSKLRSTKICGDTIYMRHYESSEISSFFTQALGVACQLVRLPPTGSCSSASRFSKAHLQQHQLSVDALLPDVLPSPDDGVSNPKRPILLSNESPILVVSRSSLNRVNELIKASGGKAAQAEVFRANIVVAEDYGTLPGLEQPYAEDHWRYMQVGSQYFQVLGSCRRCQMICIDQQTGEKNEEPFATLARTRRFDGKVFFGQHACHLPMLLGESTIAQNFTVKVGETVRPFLEGEIGDMGLLEAHRLMRYNGGG
ncbi:PLP-dependent transferase [Pseudovirgaria hyperparasitica]|uniref:Molybdenum cofactor sulfurase n=1 Tax=Pseudovirgaria hyperparasitica TaxID=470096 RepID=A0A6A6VSQ8_9PEZI|nr:PLP-dependent transferase [Pseudovirgaria hyperparasitica]KAF2752794.1 PLP-dependent transferase [Pseudovirgaria hyperparasitica]